MVDLQYDNTTCVVCFKNVLYYSIGECDHPVCFECSTRMRVLCLQNECPICRRDLSKVVFTDTVQPFKEIHNKMFLERLFERQFKIGFCTEAIREAYDRLLENQCKLCDKPTSFRTFNMLNDHMRKVHEKFYCDLCVKHLRIFTCERKCYTRQELAHHRRKGDLDDTSHRGHPLCEFCEERFMDADELYRHLRKEHLYCHLCDADGRNLYYATHSALAQHFRTDHYLCEEGECAGQHLTAVFRSEIDLKAHKATIHGKGMPRGAARQARTLELQFNITPHPVVQRVPRERVDRAASPPATAAPVPEARIDTGSDEQFPRLSHVPPSSSINIAAPVRNYRGTEGLARTDKNFPALDGAGPSRSTTNSRPTTSAPSSTTVAATIVRNTKPSVSIQLHSQPASASNFRLTQTSGNRISIPPKKTPLSDDDFPSLGISKDDHPSIGAGTVQPPKVTLINSQEMQALKKNQSSSQPKKSQLNSEAFPALSSTVTPTAPPQWIRVTKPKEKQKVLKLEPPPQPREPSFNQVADFPTLPVNNKAKPKKTQPSQSVPQPPPAQNDKASKKERKKQNSKKENHIDNYVNGVTDKRIPNYASSFNNNSTENDKKIQTVENATGNTNKNGGNGDFALAAKDYPPLSSKVENSVPEIKKKMPNGMVPPGFKPRPACDGMTFTNSSGQTFPAPVHRYIPPPDFENRNRALVNNFAVALGGAAALENFKVASRAFRDNISSADEFYAHCRIALGSHFENVFPELVALLPDIAKQQELVVGKDVESQLAVCSVCGQLLAPCDSISHDTAHWPPLGHAK